MLAEAALSNRFVPSRALLIWISSLTIAIDQGTKYAIRTLLSLHDSVSVIPGFLDFTYVRNTGAAFGLLNSSDIPFKPAIMTAIALTALVTIVIYALKAPSQSSLNQIGLTLVIGGAVGNLIDRVTMGYVVDFIDVYWGNWHFWAFNIADAAITVGACLLILDMLLAERYVSKTV